MVRWHPNIAGGSASGQARRYAYGETIEACTGKCWVEGAAGHRRSLVSVARIDRRQEGFSRGEEE